MFKQFCQNACSNNFVDFSRTCFFRRFRSSSTEKRTTKWPSLCSLNHLSTAKQHRSPRSGEVVIIHWRKWAAHPSLNPLTHFSIQELLNLDLCSTHYLLMALFMGGRDKMKFWPLWDDDDKNHRYLAHYEFKARWTR